MSESKDPSKQPNNKSLLIFNINIWYLYQQVMKDDCEMKDKAEQMLADGTKALVGFNLGPVKKEYEGKSLGKLLDLCADLGSLRSKPLLM